MSEKIVVRWQNSYSVGIKLVDEQHMELIKLTNKLFANCMAGRERSNSVFLDIVREAIDYTGYHFGIEEKIMERVNYPDFARHKRDHGAFVQEVLNKAEEFKAGKILTPLSFVYFLRDWVLHHIAVNDKKMGDYLLNMRKSGELQQITLKVRKDEASDRLQIR